ncbi:MAG: hypothetical protein RBS05_13620 [Zoogloea oleivorans]|uniref:Uncharacterized protein n=1 Tax=Zoogloea oleivorans TaxID=1552750 RepID=A0A6C2CM04_9RHOO|nr:hypothetical protein [Zoogloea oleivorans]MDY0036943.1 hypothetical protein [Zoogloea oleivorans]TYC54372.1 hypothetical protein ETQ85_19285 [Zoogloea oleivorans]
MTMATLALLVVLPTGWAMAVKLADGGPAGLACQAKGAAFAVFQLAVMVGLVVLDTWWGMLFYAFLMLATGHMFLEALSKRYPASRLGAWWGQQQAAAVSRRK